MGFRFEAEKKKEPKPHFSSEMGFCFFKRQRPSAIHPRQGSQGEL
jgi:hypothetical protein